MRTVLRRAAATSAALGTLMAGAVALAPTAAAATSCTTTNMTVDNRGYSGPWNDNWDLKAKVCSYRSGSYIYSYAQLSWDAPWTHGGDWSIFDGAGFRVYLKKHSSCCSDPIKRYKTFYFEDRMESGDGSYTTSTIRYPISRWALGDGAWKLDWNNDGRGYSHYGVKASPLV